MEEKNENLFHRYISHLSLDPCFRLNFRIWWRQISHLESVINLRIIDTRNRAKNGKQTGSTMLSSLYKSVRSILLPLSTLLLRFFPLLVRMDSIGTATEELASEKFSFLSGHEARVSSVPVFVVEQGIQSTWNALLMAVQAAMFP